MSEEKKMSSQKGSFKIKDKKDYLEIIKRIKEHDKHYYEECKPIISDYKYDLLVKEAEKFEKEHPELIAKDSPTKKVGETISKGFVQGKHVKPMLSLSNTYSDKEIEDFINRVKRLLEQKEVSFCLELKMDGTAISLRYEEGIFKRALTRGDGKTGDDVTANIRTIKSIPQKLKGKYPDLLEVRGEVFMNKQTFKRLNEEREKNKKALFANPRNAAAGSLKMLDFKEVAKRNLEIVCYGVAEGEAAVDSQFEIHRYLKKLGLPVSDEKHFKKVNSLKQILEFAEKIDKKRFDLSFEIDGIVIKADNLKTHQNLGVTGKSPRYAVAYKFGAEQAYTKIKDITVQVGRTGTLTPVAELEPVALAGSTISRATLHNEEEVKRKDIRIGDTVLIEKGGDVIPKVVSVDLKKRKNKKDILIWKMPNNCPVCHTKVVRKKEEVAVRCPNANCYGKRLRHLIFFAGKNALDIDHLGEKVVAQLVNKGFITNPSDIYELTKDELSQLENFKDKSINNLLRSIEKSKDCSLARFIMGLEIKYVGKETAELLAQETGNLNNLEKMTKEDLLQIEGIGEKVADSIVEYFKDETHLEEIKKLLSCGLKLQSLKKKKIQNSNFMGKVFVLTGTLQEYTRDEASSLIKERGGKTSNSVSKKTDYLLKGEEAGSKYEKAKKLNIKIIIEEEFKKMLY